MIFFYFNFVYLFLAFMIFWDILLLLIICIFLNLLIFFNFFNVWMIFFQNFFSLAFPPVVNSSFSIIIKKM